MSARTISPELVTALKRLRLGGLLPTLVERFTLAEKDDTPYEDLLLMLLTDEIVLPNLEVIPRLPRGPHRRPAEAEEFQPSPKSSWASTPAGSTRTRISGSCGDHLPCARSSRAANGRSGSC